MLTTTPEAAVEETIYKKVVLVFVQSMFAGALIRMTVKIIRKISAFSLLALSMRVCVCEGLRRKRKWSPTNTNPSLSLSFLSLLSPFLYINNPLTHP
jgi:hypothetical protein